MKTIDELGISQTPWERTDNHPRIVWNGENLPLVTGIRPSDARLIAAAPDMYVALRNMRSVWAEIRDKSEYNGGLLKDIPMFINASFSAFKALEKAGGLEVKK